MNNTEGVYWREVIDPGDRASKMAKEICFQSHKNSNRVHIVPHQPGNFRGPVGFVWKKGLLNRMSNYHLGDSGAVTDWDLTESVENDGAGGKPQFFTLLGEAEVFYNLGWEIIAMTADDFARSGRLPVVIDNEVNAKRITEKNFHLFEATMHGYSDALKKARLVNITGETAIMKHSITAFCDFNDDSQLVLTWGASCIGLCDRNKLIDGSLIIPGLPIIGLHEEGYRCNGGTFFTNLILHKWGKNPQELCTNQNVRNFVRSLTVPSKSYASFITNLIGWEDSEPVDILGIAHITGGGIWGKFKEILPQGVGARLDTMPNPPEVLHRAQLMSEGTPYRLSDWQAYGTLHGGCGMLLVCAPSSVGTILRQAGHQGIEASIVGKTISSETNEVLIKSRFLYESDKELSSERMH